MIIYPTINLLVKMDTQFGDNAKLCEELVSADMGGSAFG